MTKPDFSFLGSFYIVVYFVTDACLRLLCLFQFFSTKTRLAGKNVSEMTNFVSGGMKNLNSQGSHASWKVLDLFL